MSCHVFSFHDLFSCEVTFVYHHEGMALHSKYIDKKRAMPLNPTDRVNIASMLWFIICNFS